MSVPTQTRFCVTAAFVIACLIAPMTVCAQSAQDGGDSRTQGRRPLSPNPSASAEQAARLAVALAEQAYGADSPAVAERLVDLLRLLRNQGDFVAARHESARALAIAERANQPVLLTRVLREQSLVEFELGDTTASLRTARRLRTVAAQSFAEGDVALTSSLVDAGSVLAALGTKSEADEVLQRAVRLAEREGSEELLAAALVGLARLHRPEQLPLAQAELERALAIRERVLGPDDAGVAEVLQRLGEVSYERGQYAKAVEYSERALRIRERTLGPEHRRTADVLANLSTAQRAFGRFAEAEQSALRAQRIYETAYGPESPEVGRTLASLGNLYRLTGRFTRAEESFSLALAIFDKTGRVGDVVFTQTARSALYLSSGRYRESETVLRHALALAEPSLPPNHRDVIAALDNLASTCMLLGRYSEAEPLRRRVLELRERAMGPEHRLVALALLNLANLYMQTERPEAAEPLMRRAIVIYEKAFGATHMDVGRALSGLGRSLRAQRRMSEAEALFRQALAIQEATVGRDHQETNLTALALADVLRAQERAGEAEPLVKRVVASFERTLQPLHPELAMALMQLAHLDSGAGRLDQALVSFDRALLIRRASLGADHKDVASTLQDMAHLQLRRQEPAAALMAAREATAILRLRAASAASGADLLVRSELQARRRGFELHLDLLDPGERILSLGATAEGFAVAQLARASDTAASVAQLAARLAAGDDELARLVRRRQDLVLRQRFLEAELLRQVVRNSKARDEAAIDQLRRELSGVEQDGANALRDLELRFPDYPMLVSREPIGIAEIQALLRQDEALLSYLVSDDAVYAWVVRTNSARLQRLVIGRRQLTELVIALRAAMRPGLDGALPQFPLQAAYDGYRALLEPVMAALAGARHILVVPDGPLQSLPLGLLVSAPPPTTAQSLPNWLARQYAFSTLPTEASLRALRRFASVRHAPEPFVGFGAPAFKGGGGPLRGAAALYSLRGLAAVERLEQLDPLPDTAIEVRAIARSLGASEQAIFLGPAATETQVKRQNLRRYRTVAFATHGFVSGEMPGLAEPALAFTPPSVATEEDDGLLTASEAARLQLNADLVILSACSTAASDGTPRAEALSGLARSFIFAGARALLVSHWPVDSRAATQITALTFMQLQARANLRKDEALRRAMVELMQRPQFRHPMFWAPFVFVGADG